MYASVLSRRVAARPSSAHRVPRPVLGKPWPVTVPPPLHWLQATDVLQTGSQLGQLPAVLKFIDPAENNDHVETYFPAGVGAELLSIDYGGVGLSAEV